MPNESDKSRGDPPSTGKRKRGRPPKKPPPPAGGPVFFDQVKDTAAPPAAPRAVVPRDEPAAAGLTCRACGCQHFFVVYVRRRPGRIMRRRECRYCGRRVVTIEHITNTSG